MTIWISRRPADQVAAEQEAALDAGLPLGGLTFAVKDNIDLAGLPTTCACPAYAYMPERDAAAVARLRAGGAVPVGKTNLDQFATGLVGTRSPYGAVRDVRRPEYVGGGSSSGSAAAVALGEVDFALGTDTAGSGRIPAAFQGVIGAKPSIGRVPTDGVVPACRSFDCVSVFARSVDLAERVLETMSGAAQSARRPTRTTRRGRFATFDGKTLAAASPAYRRALAAPLEELGAEPIDGAPFLEAGRLLYGGAFLAERCASVGEFIAGHIEDCDPVVAGIILDGRRVTATTYLRDRERLAALRDQVTNVLAEFDGLILPTAPFQPTVAAVAADPVAVNHELGVFTTFCNVLDLCAYAVPAGEADGGQFGLTVLAPAGCDHLVAGIARSLVGEPPRPPRTAPGAIELLVVGAHLSGMPLNHELLERDGAMIEEVCTSDAYRLFALDTVPPKPGLVRGEDGSGAEIAGELWALPASGLGSLLASLPQPMTLGRVALADGREAVGFLCEPASLEHASEITSFGGWRSYVASPVSAPAAG